MQIVFIPGDFLKELCGMQPISRSRADGRDNVIGSLMYELHMIFSEENPYPGRIDLKPLKKEEVNNVCLEQLQL